MVSQDEEVDKIDYQLTEDDGKLVPGNQCTADTARSDFGNIHRTDGRSQSHTYTTYDAVKIERQQKRIGGFPVRKYQKFRIV